MSKNQTHIHLFQRPEYVDLDKAVSLLLSDDPFSEKELENVFKVSSIEKEMKQKEKANNANNNSTQQPIVVK